MDRDVNYYYVIVNLNTLKYVDEDGDLVNDIYNAKRYYNKIDAENYLLNKEVSFRNKCAIYKVHVQIELEKVMEGSSVGTCLNLHK